MIVSRYKIGRCANGAQRDGGYLRHAFIGDAWESICGQTPGKSSAGWSHEGEPANKVNCPRCLKRISQPSDIPTRNAD